LREPTSHFLPAFRRFDNFDPAEYQLVLPEEDEQLNPLAGPVRAAPPGGCAA